MDDEEHGYLTLDEPLYRVETGNYEYRFERKCFLNIWQKKDVLLIQISSSMSTISSWTFCSNAVRYTC